MYKLIRSIFASTAKVRLFVLGLAVATTYQGLCDGGEVGSRYFPLSEGNSWVYTVGGNQKKAMRTIKWTVTQREVIAGNPVFHLWEEPSEGDEPLSLYAQETGIVEAGTDRFLLKNGLRTGDRWSSKSRSFRTPGATDSSEVMSAGRRCSVGNRSFDDCAIIRDVSEANNIVMITTYARGVGPVKYVYFKGLHSEEVDTTLTIESWVVH